MPPLLPRLQLFEIADQPWFPPTLRRHFQAALTTTWGVSNPFASSSLSPAAVVSRILIQELGVDLPRSTIIDFCAGAGGPTPIIERDINAHLRKYKESPVPFILTDIFPNIAYWETVSRSSPHISFYQFPVDAAKIPSQLAERLEATKVIRTFHLAFHHFHDTLAKQILDDAMRSGHTVAIFELQNRSDVSLVAVTILGIGAMVLAPYYALRWRSLIVFVFSCVVPILPFVLAFNGYISSARTREPEEIEALLSVTDVGKWEMTSGCHAFLWPVGYVNWVICKHKGPQKSSSHDY